MMDGRNTVLLLLASLGIVMGSVCLVLIFAIYFIMIEMKYFVVIIIIAIT